MIGAAAPRCCSMRRNTAALRESQDEREAGLDRIRTLAQVRKRLLKHLAAEELAKRTPPLLNAEHENVVARDLLLYAPVVFVERANTPLAARVAPHCHIVDRLGDLELHIRSRVALIGTMCSSAKACEERWEPYPYPHHVRSPLPRSQFHPMWTRPRHGQNIFLTAEVLSAKRTCLVACPEGLRRQAPLSQKDSRASWAIGCLLSTGRGRSMTQGGRSRSRGENSDDNLTDGNLTQGGRRHVAIRSCFRSGARFERARIPRPCTDA